MNLIIIIDKYLPTKMLWGPKIQRSVLLRGVSGLFPLYRGWLLSVRETYCCLVMKLFVGRCSICYFHSIEVCPLRRFRKGEISNELQSIRSIKESSTTLRLIPQNLARISKRSSERYDTDDWYLQGSLNRHRSIHQLGQIHCKVER